MAVLYCEPVETGTAGQYWCRPEEAAQMVGVSTTTLRDWAQHGLITVVHHPGSRIWLHHLPELRLLAEIVQALKIRSDAETKNRALLAEHVTAALDLGWQ
ncbi:hypothetical protein E1287_15250 [Actinomadura sp. KC06]|uniref:MerR family transcriptional regulator n=1 Tax=Actinomadura sp. KC06 TaxID=2530369 RepID=UPI00104C3B6F|nr:MerR family transcriptional regulator [Actinomadura sp. KC06]TDD34976.1 hypothetical protein E1287_15250 [Actinomadura sp. KC06]